MWLLSEKRLLERPSAHCTCILIRSARVTSNVSPAGTPCPRSQLPAVGQVQIAQDSLYAQTSGTTYS